MTLGRPLRLPTGAADPGLAFGAFVSLMAGLMAVNALSIDSMLTALPAMSVSLHLTGDNERQWIISAFIIGFGVPQLLWGPLADRYGRRPILLAGLVSFAMCSALAGAATSFPLLIAARVLQGFAASVSRVLVTSIIRDCFEGRQMARVTSLCFMVFLAVPILAPSVGHVILVQTGSWRTIFYFLSLFGAVMAAINAARLRETLHPEYRRAFSLANIGAAMLRVVRTRSAIGYTAANMLTYGTIVGFITSIQQIFSDRFHALEIFPYAFAGMAGAMGMASLLNARVVGRLGARRVSHAALIGFIGSAGLHLLIAATGHDSLAAFVILQAFTLFCFALLGANFTAMAMDEMGPIAGPASSVQGFITTCGGALIGALIGQSYDGTTVPLYLGYTVVGVGALLCVIWTERGRLFRAHHPEPIAAPAQ